MFTAWWFVISMWKWLYGWILVDILSFETKSCGLSPASFETDRISFACNIVSRTRGFRYSIYLRGLLFLNMDSCMAGVLAAQMWPYLERHKRQFFATGCCSQPQGQRGGLFIRLTKPRVLWREVFTKKNSIVGLKLKHIVGLKKTVEEIFNPQGLEFHNTRCYQSRI